MKLTYLYLTSALFSGAYVFAAVSQTASSIHIKTGQTYRLELKSNPTTGYSWYPLKQVSKKAPISIIKSGYEADHTGLVGSGGMQYWEIKGKKAGSYKLTLHYKRPWEKKVDPIEVKKFMITVE